MPVLSLVVLAATVIYESPDFWQLAVSVLIAALYILLWSQLAASRRDAASSGRAPPHGAAALPQRRYAQHQACRRSGAPRPELRQDSKVPVLAPRFASDGFDEQVRELLVQIMPTPESERLARELAQCAKAAIQQVFPEVDVKGFASGDVARGTAFGVAVPELDIVASASPHVLVQHLQGRLSKGGLSMAKMDMRKLQKSAIRVCTDYLVQGGFKFRRSAFRGQDPKVTLMAPPCASGQRIPMDFTVNSMTPLYNAALLTECGRIDVRARSLALLVRRWAKDRGICHAAKGHLAPYAWTLLAVYFMQVGIEGCPLLPPLQGFKMASGLIVRRGSGEADARNDGRRREGSCREEWPASQLLVSDLFLKFVHFYAKEFDWHKEAVSVRLGRRASANLHLMLHIIVNEDRSTEVGPSLEDPFEPARNLGMSATAMGMTRMREEFARAHALTTRSASLSELLEPWAPAERMRGGSSDEGGEREEDDACPDGPAVAAASAGQGGAAASSVNGAPAALEEVAGAKHSGE